MLGFDRWRTIILFYYDANLKKYEAEYSFDDALLYLESLFIENADVRILNTLIGFSWYYLVEGPLISKKYGEDPSQLPLFYWKKYLSIGFAKYKDDPFFCFIAGYTLLLDGYVFLEEYRSKNMPTCMSLLEKAIESGNRNVAALAQCIVSIERNKKSKSHKVDKNIVRELFPNGSLIEKDFFDCYT